MDHKEYIPKCIKHKCDLLPLFCRDCDHLLCSDCIITDHVTHNFCKVSEVAEFHQHELEKILKSSDSKAELVKLLQRIQKERIHLAEDSEKLICQISHREEEIIQRAKLWSKKMIEKIDSIKERHDFSMKQDENVIEVLLHFEEQSTEMVNQNIAATFLHCQAERLLSSTCQAEFTENKEVFSEYWFDSGPSGEDLDTIFGRLENHCEEGSASDAFNEDDENESEPEDERTFYECYEKNVSRLYQTSTKGPIDGIVTFDERRFFIISNGTLFSCDLNNSVINQRIITRDVFQIAQIPSTGELLYILNDQKEIYRLSQTNIKTRFLHTKEVDKAFCAVSAGRYEVYACVMLRYVTYENYWYNYHNSICLLDEYGVVLKKYYYLMDCSRKLIISKWVSLPAKDLNNYIVLGLHLLEKVEKVDAESGKKIATYSGSVGVNPGSQFSPLDMAMDDEDNVLLVVKDDRAIHLLDKSLKFQRLLLTEEDGLQSPCSIDLDKSGYLWVGCRDRKIHVFNYQYLLTTERCARCH